MRTIRCQRRAWRSVLVALATISVLSAPAAHAQDADAARGIIVGRVIRAQTQTARGVAGASVQVQGTRLGAQAGPDGRYRIANVPAGTYTLVARYIGYAAERRQVTVSAGEEVTADFALLPAAISLEEVVVTGTAGGELRRSVGHAVSTINAGEELSRSAAPDLGSLLNARAPGVVIAPATSRLGAGPDIQIRGRSSMSLENAPLLYIDGVRVNNAVGTGPETGSGGLGSQNAGVAGRMNDISPEDIERIEVIKGPAAATIYGTEAANGVIQIITKRGAAGAKPQLTLQVQTGSLYFRDPEGRVPTNYFPDENGNPVAWNGVKSEADRGTPIFRTGQTRRYDASLAGGRDLLQYYIGLNYENDIGIEVNNSLKQFGTHGTFTLAPTPAVDVVTSLNYVNRTAHLGADYGVSPLLGAEIGHALLFTGSRGFFPYPPELPQQLYDNFDGVNRFTGSVTVNHRPLPWFSQRLIAGVDYTGEDSHTLERFAPPDLAPFLSPSDASGQIHRVLRQNNVFTGDYSATAKFNLSPSLSSASSLGAQYYRTELDKSTLGGLGFPSAGIETVTGTARPSVPTQDPSTNTTIGGYAQEQVGWNDRLFLTGALRVDNNSAFGEEFKWVTYPKLSAAWVVTEEPLSGWASMIDLLRLRAAYGESGRQPATLSALRTYRPVAGPGGSSAVTPGNFGNPNLKPERGRELEAGFELGAFRRLNLDFTYFTKRTSDEIIQQPVAPSGGFSENQLRNLGRVDNHGIELQASLQAVASENFAWDVVGNVATSKDVIKSLGELSGVLAPGQNNAIGHPIQGYFARRVVSADRDPATGFATNVLCAGGPGSGPVPCDQAPLLYVGTPTPKVTGSLSNSFTLFKRLRLYGLVDFKRGHRLENLVEELRCTGFIGVGLCDANYHPEKYSPIYLAQLSTDALGQGINEAFIQDASFVKLREISATYTLPTRWVPGTSRASLTLAARELHTWTKYRGIDPEVNLFTGSTEDLPPGLAADQAVMPPLSRFIATLNVAF